MNARQAIAAVLILVVIRSHAQQPVNQPDHEPVPEQFGPIATEKPNEVTVVLPPPDEPAAAPVPEPQATPEPVLVVPQNTPVLVSPQPPETAKPNSPEAVPAAPPATGEIPEEPPQQPRSGLAVQVEKLQTGNGSIDPAQVKLLAPFPAKPLARPPAGWHLETSENAPLFTREIELSPGKKITLSVRPHLLAPETDGAASFQVAEPGFDAPLGYRQTHTVGAILSTSIRQLENDSKQLGGVIDQLQQLLVSLPKPQPVAAPPPPPESKPATLRKR